MTTEDRVLAGVSHLGILFSGIGLVIPLAIILIKQNRSPFVMRHAKQAIGYQVVILLITFLLGIFTGGIMYRFGSGTFSLMGFISLAFIIYGIVGGIQGFLGRYFKYVLIGDFLDRI